MVKQFKGEVKISDVQNEFDTLVGRINKMVDVFTTLQIQLKCLMVYYSLKVEYSDFLIVF